MSEFYTGQPIKVDGKLGKVIEAGLPDTYGGNNTIRYQLDGETSIISDNPAIARHYANRTFEAIEKDSIVISEELDADGNTIDDSYAVTLTGKPADLYSISDDYFDSLVGAHEFAEQVSEETQVAIEWDCMKPGWA